MKVVYLSPSTQENNVGIGHYGTEEQQMNVIADYLELLLQFHCVKVYRNTPEMTLAEVVRDSNRLRVDLHLAIHSNAGGGKGTEVFCHKKGQAGETFANNIYKEVAAITPSPDRGVKEGYAFFKGLPMYELAHTLAPSALIEIEYHDSIVGATFIAQNRRKIAISLCKGILKTLDIKWIL